MTLTFPTGPFDLIYADPHRGTPRLQSGKEDVST